MKKSSYYIFFSNLSNPLRIEIVEALQQGSKSVSQLTDSLDTEQSKVSHALKSLRCCNIVTFVQKGKERIYSLNKETVVPILKLIDIHAKKFCSGGCNCKKW
jgi:DNA-binding transcriptional ArsR family regulator